MIYLFWFRPADPGWPWACAMYGSPRQAALEGLAFADRLHALYGDEKEIHCTRLDPAGDLVKLNQSEQDEFSAGLDACEFDIKWTPTQ